MIAHRRSQADTLDRLLWDRWRGKVIRGGALSRRSESLFTHSFIRYTTASEEVMLREKLATNTPNIEDLMGRPDTSEEGSDDAT